MAIKRKFPPRVATVYCSGGCRAKKDEDGGKIVQRGTHDELIQEDGIYADFDGGKKAKLCVRCLDIYHAQHYNKTHKKPPFAAFLRVSS